MTHAEKVAAGDPAAVNIEERKTIFWQAVVRCTQNVELAFDELVRMSDELAELVHEPEDVMFLRTVPAGGTTSPRAKALIRFWIENNKADLENEFCLRWYNDIATEKANALKEVMENRQISVQELETFLNDLKTTARAAP